jgi:pseudouridine kinase
MNCPLCDGPPRRNLSTKKRSFFVCDSCGFIWADPKTHLDQEAERTRYRLHENSRDNDGYVNFITAILDRGLQRWETLHHIDEPTGGTAACKPLVLDWGAGPEPLATELLRDRGYEVQSYDPLFGPPLPPLDRLFDIILCIEVAEHFKRPPEDFITMARYLKPGGLLLIHTHTLQKDLFAAKENTLREFFSPWWYKEDPTHVSFYSERSLRALGFISGLRYEKPEGAEPEKLHFFVKPLPIIVVGGANVDIEGRPFGPLKDRDSNPGQVRFSRGGAGRNMAENLARLGMPVQFISVFSKDPLSHLLYDETKAAGVALDGVFFAESKTPSCYLSILDDTGDVKLALSSMETISLLNPETLQQCLSTLIKEPQNPERAFSNIIADGNLLPETIEALLDRLAGIPAWFDPVSTAKARRTALYKDGHLLGRFYGLKPNRDELLAIAEALHWQWSEEISPDLEQFIERICPQGLTTMSKPELAQLLMAGQYLLKQGCQELHVSMGSEGVILMNGSCILWGRPPVLPMVSATGAGDSYLAAAVRTRCLEPVSQGPATVVSSGCAASAITLQDQDAVSPHMGALALYRLLKSWEKNNSFTVIQI